MFNSRHNPASDTVQQKKSSSKVKYNWSSSKPEAPAFCRHWQPKREINHLLSTLTGNRWHCVCGSSKPQQFLPEKCKVACLCSSSLEMWEMRKKKVHCPRVWEPTKCKDSYRKWGLVPWRTTKLKLKLILKIKGVYGTVISQANGGSDTQDGLVFFRGLRRIRRWEVDMPMCCWV